MDAGNGSRSRTDLIRWTTMANKTTQGVWHDMAADPSDRTALKTRQAQRIVT